MDWRARTLRKDAAAIGGEAVKSWYFVSYDVRDDRRLRHVARKIEGYGTRLQFSVFRCHLSRRSIERLRWELARVLEPEDSLVIVPLCDGCVGKIQIKGPGADWTISKPGFTIL